MRIDVYHHLVIDGTSAAKLNTLMERTGRIMATQDEILTKLAEANASLDGIQADILALKDMVAAGADLSAISGAVNALVDKAAGIDTQTP